MNTETFSPQQTPSAMATSCQPMPGSIRVFSLRPDQRENGPEPGETVVRVDRENPVLGNPYTLHNQNDPDDRDRVIAAYVIDSEADWLRNGPRRRAIDALAARVAAGERVALACWCKPRACHGDWIAEKVNGRIAEIHTRHAIEQNPHGAVLLDIARMARQGVLSGLQDTHGIPESSLIAGACLHASYLALTFLRRWHPAFSVTPCGGGGGLRGYGALTARGGLLGHYWLEVTDPDGTLWILDATSDQFGWDPITLDLASRLTGRYRKEDPALSLAALEEIAAEIEGEQSAVRANQEMAS